MPEFQPCEACTALEPGRCQARANPMLCCLLAKRPKFWGPQIAQMPPSDVEPRELPPAPPDPPLPSAAAMVVNATKAVITHIATGAKLASPELQAARLQVCAACDHFRRADDRCGGEKGCGCLLSLKITWLDQKCPLDRWPQPEGD